MGWLVTVVTIAVVITAYLGLRVIRPLPLPAWLKRLLFFIVAFLVIGQRFVWILRKNGHDHHLMDSLDLAGYTFLGFISFVMIMMLARDVLSIAARIGDVFASRRKRAIFFKEQKASHRRLRLNLSNVAILLIAVPLTAYSVHTARSLPRVTEVEIEIPHLPEQLDGYRILQVTDTHVGPTLKKPWVQRLVNLINEQHADMIVHTGDLVDGRAWWLKPDVAPFAEMNAPYKFFTTGNHEYYSGVDEWIREARFLGMVPLVNESVVIDVNGAKLLIAGVPDTQGGRFREDHTPRTKEVMDRAAEHDVSILLAHRPDIIFDADRAGVDIQLSGHTHGGQFFPWTLAVACFNPYVYGLHDHGHTQIFVSNGAGYWGPPLRLGAPPEIAVITLRKI
ncbi:metallophosphoesterase [Salidesulfovibrio brasiliensis]|uniref:metallophosphoesterase n=1 Tax=Salidesulfovibrio brasiliensis TaxID=221711 RepID=UPI0006CF4519|nr:metallophosphoesterase [Salidesulfovibrio brasiliensis]